MVFELTELQVGMRDMVRDLCRKYPGSYWRELDKTHEYPDAFVRELTQDGWLSILIPEEYGGGGQGFVEAAIVLEEINRSGGDAAACHAQMYTMGAVLRHGSEEQKQRYLPKIASGELRLQSFGVTEPDAGSDTTSIRTFAVRKHDRYVVNGQKIFISRARHSDLLLLVARTTPLEQVKKKTDGITLFLVDMRDAGDRLRIQPIEIMTNHETNALFFDDLEVPVENRIGEEGQGFKYLLSGLNTERILVASDCLGSGFFFVDHTTEYTGRRIVFGRPIGQNQGVQFPIAKAYINLQAASLMRFQAAALFDAGKPCGPEANMAKYLSSEACWEAANAAMTAFGGYGYAVEYDIERKFRESRLAMVAPISNNLVLSFIGQHVLGMPRSF